MSFNPSFSKAHNTEVGIVESAKSTVLEDTQRSCKLVQKIVY